MMRSQQLVQSSLRDGREPRRARSVKTVRCVATLRPGSQAPLGAARRPTAPPRKRDMPLLTELEISVAGVQGHKHAAPNGAIPFGQECGLSGLEFHDDCANVETMGYCQPSLRDEGVRSGVATLALEWPDRSGPPKEAE